MRKLRINRTYRDADGVKLVYLGRERGEAVMFNPRLCRRERMSLDRFEAWAAGAVIMPLPEKA